jgi:hypothetical protein
VLRTAVTGFKVFFREQGGFKGNFECDVYLSCGIGEGALVECSERSIELGVSPRELSAQARLDRTVSSLQSGQQSLGFRV